MTITITGLPLQGTILDTTLIPVETAGTTGHIAATSIRNYISAGTLTSIDVGTGTFSGALTADGGVFATDIDASGAITATSLETSGDVTVNGSLYITTPTPLVVSNITAINANISANINMTGAGFITPSSNAVGALGASNKWVGNAFVAVATIGSQTTGLITPSSNAAINIGSTTNWFNNFYTSSGVFNSIVVNSGNLTPGSNAVVNIGSSSAWFNNIYGTASHALYADLAEKYQSDEQYAPGTVLVFGDETEVTISMQANDTRVAGVVSTDPAYLMNGALADGIPVALQGRVPCKVIGVVKRGDMLVTSDSPGIAMTNNIPQIGSVIGKALGNHDGNGIGVIEVVVGRI